MNRLIQTTIMLAAGGLVLTLAESLLPRSAARSAARAAIGLLFLELLACSVIGIFR